MQDLLEILLELRMLPFHDILLSVSFFSWEDVLDELAHVLRFQFISEIAELQSDLLE